MKAIQSLLLAALIVMNIGYAETDNLKGATRNLNILKLQDHAWLTWAAGKDDHHNIIRDMAVNCDNPDFELVVKLTIKPFAIMKDIGEIQRAMPMLSLDDAYNFYALSQLAQTEKHVDNFINYNLNEMLSYRDENGKTIADILADKQTALDKDALYIKQILQVLYK